MYNLQLFLLNVQVTDNNLKEISDVYCAEYYSTCCKMIPSAKFDEAIRLLNSITSKNMRQNL